MIQHAILNNPAMEHFFRNALALAHSDRVCLLRYDQSSNRLECIHGENCVIEQKRRNSPCSLAVRYAHPSISNLLTNGNSKGYFSSSEVSLSGDNGSSSPNLRTFIRLDDPGNSPLGLLVFESNQTKLEDHQIEFAKFVAELPLFMLQQSRSLADSSKMVTKLSLLSDTSNILLSDFESRPLSEKLDYVVEKALEILDAELCSLWLARDKHICLETSYSQKGKVEFAKGVVLPIRSKPRSGITGSIAFHKKVFNEFGDGIVTYPSRNPENSANFVESSKIYSELAYPMVDSEDNLIGLLFAFNKKGQDGKPFKDRGFSRDFDESLMKILTTKIGIAIKNAQLRRDLEKTQFELSHLLETVAIEEALAGLTHDIKNVLSQIVGEVGWLHKLEQNKALDLMAVRSAFEKIDSCVKTVEKFTDSLKGRASKIDAILMPYDLNRVLDKAVELISGKALRSTVTILRKNETLDICVLVDFDLLVRAFFNIMTNAIAAMQTGGILRIQVKHLGEFLEVSISDTGCGIPGCMLNKVLSPFVTTKEKGYGLGLVVARRIIEIDHNGKLILESKEGRGTTVKVSLPFVEEIR